MDPDIQRPATNGAGSPRGGSLDGFRPLTTVRPQAAQNLSPISATQSAMNAPIADINANTAMQTLDAQKPAKAKSSRGLKVTMWLFIILFLAALGGAGYLYMQYDTVKSDLASEKSTTASLRTQLSDAQTEADIASQTGDKALEDQTEYATNLSTVATQLKTKCGSACSGITIPTTPQ